jgi:hypothetical protein
MPWRQGFRLQRTTAIAVIAAMLVFGQTCAFHAGMCGAGNPEGCVGSASEAGTAILSHSGAGPVEKPGDDCCGEHGATTSPRSLTCCSSWGAGEVRCELRAPSASTEAHALPPAISGSLLSTASTVASHPFDLDRAGAPPPIHSVLRL